MTKLLVLKIVSDDHVNMYIAKKEAVLQRKVYFHTRANNKNKPIFFTFRMVGWGRKEVRAGSLCHIVIT